MQCLELRVPAEPAAGEVEGGELGRQEAFRLVGAGGVLHDDGGRGPDGPERAKGEGGLEHVDGLYHDVAPDVTVADEELRVGGPTSSWWMRSVPGVPRRSSAADFDDEDVDVAEVFTALASGRSWATTTPMATVAPAAATIAPRVSVRSRDCTLSLSAGVLGWAESGM